MPLGKTVTSVRDVIAIAEGIIEAAENEIVWVAPSSILVFTSQYAISEKVKMFIQNGGRVRGIVDFTHPYIALLRRLLEIGEEVRSVDKYEGSFLIVADKRESLSSINFDTENLSLDASVVAFWSEDPTYAEYLVSTFEVAWGQSVPATERIAELLEQEPTHI